jgi:hypothetical protein
MSRGRWLGASLALILALAMLPAMAPAETESGPSARTGRTSPGWWARTRWARTSLTARTWSRPRNHVGRPSRASCIAKPAGGGLRAGRCSQAWRRRRRRCSRRRSGVRKTWASSRDRELGRDRVAGALLQHHGRQQHRQWLRCPHSNLSGINNTAMGMGALGQSEATGNSAFGAYSLHANTRGGGHTAIGLGPLPGPPRGKTTPPMASTPWGATRRAEATSRTASWPCTRTTATTT